MEVLARDVGMAVAVEATTRGWVGVHGVGSVPWIERMAAGKKLQAVEMRIEMLVAAMLGHGQGRRWCWGSRGRGGDGD
jgi:hypothetical protein